MLEGGGRAKRAQKSAFREGQKRYKKQFYKATHPTGKSASQQAAIQAVQKKHKTAASTSIINNGIYKEDKYPNDWIEDFLVGSNEY